MKNTSRLVSLDIARGVAALLVVLSHWVHFSPDGYNSLQSFPFLYLFQPFYVWGWVAVDFFFILSGFIFFKLYADSIQSGKTTIKTYFVNRFTRLYPLHLLTLVIVFLLQLCYRSEFNSWFIYQTNDIKSFVLNLFFASQWGIYRPAGDSFNGPVWSVSVEVVMYIGFFALCRLNLKSTIHAIIFTVIGAFTFWWLTRMGRGIQSFFMGGIVFYAYKNFSLSLLKRPIIFSATTSIVTASYIGIVYFHDNLAHQLSHDPALLKKIGDDIVVYYGALIAFPTLILLIATFDKAISARLGSLHFLGDISYASYLLHFPLQLMIAILLKSFGIFSTAYSSPVLFIGFFVVLIIGSISTFKYFERPAQMYLRSKLL